MCAAANSTPAARLMRPVRRRWARGTAWPRRAVWVACSRSPVAMSTGCTTTCAPSRTAGPRDSAALLHTRLAGAGLGPVDRRGRVGHGGALAQPGDLGPQPRDGATPAVGGLWCGAAGGLGGVWATCQCPHAGPYLGMGLAAGRAAKCVRRRVAV